MLIEWNEINTVNVAEIDDQHKQLLSIINRLFEMGSKTGGGNIRKIIAELNAYAEYHFVTEEKYFELFGYENTKEHKQEHQNYRNNIAVCEKKYQDNTADAFEHLTKFLHDWWTGHVNGSDVQYSDCFNQHGLY